jgi:hypothetical protein
MVVDTSCTWNLSSTNLACCSSKFRRSRRYTVPRKCHTVRWNVMTTKAVTYNTRDCICFMFYTTKLGIKNIFDQGHSAKVSL